MATYHSLAYIGNSKINALYTPTSQVYLLSINQLDRSGVTAEFGKGICTIPSPGRLTITRTRIENPYSADKIAIAHTSTAVPATMSAIAILVPAALAPVHIWGQAVLTAVYIHRLSSNEGLTKRDDRGGYKALDRQALQQDFIPGPTHHPRRFVCFVSKLIPAAQREGKNAPRSTPGCMMLGYVHYLTTTWKRCWKSKIQTM